MTELTAMDENKEKKFELRLDKIQNLLEKKEYKEMQKDYKTHIPAFIWLLKQLIILIVFGSIILMTLGYMGYD